MAPRIRSIKPDVWQDESFGALLPQVQLLMIGLITQADDEGYLRGNPLYVRSAVFPYHDVTLESVQAWLDELQLAGLIQQYGAGNQQYIHIKNFTKHQRVDKPRKSQFPKPHAKLPTRAAENHFAELETTENAGDSVIGIGIVLDRSQEEGIGGDRKGVEEDGKGEENARDALGEAIEVYCAALAEHNPNCNSDPSLFQDSLSLHRSHNPHISDAEFLNAALDLASRLRAKAITIRPGSEFGYFVRSLRWMDHDARKAAGDTVEAPPAPALKAGEMMVANRGEGE